ncbi:MAG: Sua5/YciO/YrdC/YwlC family protein [Duncaniella sp.]|nr:Sua5/YciO/YrdC/YwlC family protein [Duncaniella sp.]
MNLSEDISRAAAVMKSGGVILYPTDTVWGLGCDARNPGAVARIFEIKRRADSKALISLVSSEEMLRAHAGEIPEGIAGYLRDASRPTTVVYPGGTGVAGNLLGEDGSIGMRLTREAYSAALCEALGGPVVSTSANISGEPAPSCYCEISAEIREAADYTASYRRDDTAKAAPSRVVKAGIDGSVTVLRP